MGRLLERDTTLATLHRCHRDTTRRRGQLVLLRGEAGVGKTTAIARFLTELEPGTRVLRGRCDDVATPRPLGPIIDMLAGLPADQATAMRTAIATGHTAAIYARLVSVVGDGNPSVFVIENLHWADDATLDLLRYVSRRIDTLPMLLLVSYRDDQIGPAHPLATLLRDVATWATVTRIALNPLRATAVATLSTGSGINAHALDRLTGGDTFFDAEDLRWLSPLLQPQGCPTEAMQTAHASLRLLEDLGPSLQLAWSLINMAHIAALALDPACARYAARAKTLGAQFRDPAVVIRARGYTALTTVFCSDTGWEECEAVWREAAATPGLDEHGGILGVLIGVFALVRGEFGRAERYLADAAAFLDHHDPGMYQTVVAGLQALTALSLGDWTHSALTAEQILTLPGLTPQQRIAPLITVALIRARRGEEPVWPLLDEALGCATGALLRLPVHAARAEAAWLAGDDETARRYAAEVLTVSGTAYAWLGGSLRRWAHLTGGRPGTDTIAATPYELEIKGDWCAAAQEWAIRGCRYDAAIAQLGGDIDAVEGALDTFHRLGARTAARRAQQRLAHLRSRDPDRRRKDTSADPHGLTKRQRDVLELLAAGHSDAEIATALYISTKTANTHVCAVLAKLGVHNRTQAAAYAYQQPR